MESTMYEMNGQGRLVPVDKSRFTDLPNGTILEWGGNQGWEPTKYCIIGGNDSRWGKSYECFNIDKPERNAILHHVDATSIKEYDDPDLWHGQHFFLTGEFANEQIVSGLRKMHIQQSNAKAQEDARQKAVADDLEAKGRALWERLIGNVPAVIVANLEQNDSDIQTDYFASHTSKSVILAPSKHKKDVFSEMRKASELIPETAHMGRGKDIFKPYVAIGKDFHDYNYNYYYKGSRSHWHTELDKDENGYNLTFATMEEAQEYVAILGEPYPITFDGQEIPFYWEIAHDSYEHREKYSMGKGYYLASNSYHGWQVEKVVFGNSGPQREHYINLAKRYNHLEK